jgi:hypothetical protein
MPEFLFMLTRADVTVPNALELYEAIRGTDLRWVGFKDVGLPAETLRTLTARIRGDGKLPVLEVVSVDEDSELRSVRTGMDIGVEVLMGGTNAAVVAPMLMDTGIRYFPFPGRIEGHPSVLAGTIDEIVASASQLAARPGVAGLDLLAYRFAGDVPHLIREVVAAVRCPVVTAGSIDSPDRIRTVASLGAWGFTIGSAILDGTFAPGLDLRAQIELALAVASSADGSPGPVRHT